MFFRLMFIAVLILSFYSCRVEKDMRGKVQVAGRTTESAYEFKKKGYLNDLVLKGITGNLYTMNKVKGVEYVMVKWQNGYKSFGLMKDEKEYGKWYLYDKKDRLIKCSTYSEDGSFVRILEKFNKKGETTYFKHSDPPF